MTEEKQKVIKSFEECLKAPRCQDCPWESCERADCARAEMPYDLVYAALEMLKAQEARVMTLEEVEDALDTVVWVDRPLLDNSSDEYALIDAYSRKTQIVELRYPFCDKDYREKADYATYGKTWRCWTSRPTDEQREKVEWDE